jgi:RNA polymerase sigma-70 factor (ECF subfamily)
MTDLEQNHLFERLVRPHFDRLYRLAWRLTGNRAEAEDLFQELLIKSYGKLGQLRRFTRQRMHLVDEGHLPGEGLAGIAGELDPLDDPERIDRIRRLDAALAALSDDHRIIVLLHDTEGYTLSEISKLVGAPEGTIKSRLHRARARLRQILSEDGTI